MSEIRYMISDASKLVDVEAHVLRYWEEELELPIGRNEMGHRYYTEENIRLFRHIKELKDRGVQLKAIKMLLPDLEKGETEITHLIARVDKLPVAADAQTNAREEKMQQFQCIMSRLISEALEDDTEKMGLDIGTQVSGHVIKEMDYLLGMKEERERTLPSQNSSGGGGGMSGGKISTISPRTLNCPGPSTWLRRMYPAANSFCTSSSRGQVIPGLRVRVLALNSARGTVYWPMASAGTQTAARRPPASAPSTDRRRYSYSRPAPSTGRSR